jgi:hypothetical protein
MERGQDGETDRRKANKGAIKNKWLKGRSKGRGCQGAPRMPDQTWADSDTKA